MILDKLGFSALHFCFSSVTERWYYFPADLGQPDFGFAFRTLEECMQFLGPFIPSFCLSLQKS